MDLIDNALGTSKSKSIKNIPFKIRYRCELQFFTDDGKITFSPIKIKEFEKEVDYSKSFTASLNFNALFDSTHVNIIKENQDKLLVKLTLSKVKYINAKDSKPREEVETTIDVEDVFLPFFEQEDLVSFRDVPKTRDPDAPMTDALVNGQDRSLNLFEVRIYMHQLKYHEMYKKIYNFVIRGKNNGQINVATALKYICETCGVDGYIIDMPDNNIQFNNIIIPPGNVKHCIDVLQITYGVYLKDICSFYDLDGKFYILSKLNIKHEFEKDKPRVTILNVTVDRNESDHGTAIYKENNVVEHSIYKGILDSSIAIISGEAYGDSIVFTNYGYGMDAFVFADGKLGKTNPVTREFIRNATSHQDTSLSINYEYDELNNPFNMFSNLRSIGLDSFYIVASEGMDSDCLKPNVVFQINVTSNGENDNVKYAGKFFPIMSYKQKFLRDNDVTSMDIFKTTEAIILADTKEEY